MGNMVMGKCLVFYASHRQTKAQLGDVTIRQVFGESGQETGMKSVCFSHFLLLGPVIMTSLELPNK